MSGKRSKAAYWRAYTRVCWPVALFNTLGVLWVIWSYFQWPSKFTSAGAVLVCMAIISDLWLNHGVFRNSYKHLDIGLPVKVFAGSRVGIHINYIIFSEKYDFSKDPSKHILVYDNEQHTVGLGTKTSKLYARLKYLLHNPILSLLELAIPSEFTNEPFTASNPNPYSFSSYSRGWMIGKTGNRIEKSITNISAIAAILGTLIWAYGDLLLPELQCKCS